MGKKKAQAAGKAAQKAAKKAKVEKKAEKKETKNVKKTKATVEEDEEDLEAILDKMAKQWEEQHKVTEETVEGPPSKRANATLTPCPNGNHLWCIGGEYFSDDGKAYFYNDVYRYSPDKDEWRRFTSPTAPGPRSAHSVVASPIAGGKLFLFGGEFSSLHQNTFHHYRDFWVFDITTHSWDRIETKVKPSARSGHRMAIWKHFIVLFGGFHDVGIRTNYLSDLWLFDTQEYKWQDVVFRDTDRKPTARSGFSFLPIAEGIVLHGGYCKEYIKGKRPIGVALEDTWFLKMSTNPKEIKWERRKKSGYAPSLRSGCTMALWSTRSQGILFGGVSDEDKDEERLESVFHNDLYGYQTAGNGRWVSMNIRRKKKPGGAKKKPKQEAINNPSKRTNEEDEEDWDALEEDAPQANSNQVEADAAMSPQTTEAKPQSIFDTNRDPDSDEPVLPFVRYNAMLAVLRNTLYIYGGIYEHGSKEYTLDDFWFIQLDKMDGYTCLRPLETAVTTGEAPESSDDDGDDDGDDDDDDDDDGDDDENEEDEEKEDEDPEAEGPSKSKSTESASIPVVEDVTPPDDIREKAKLFMGAANDVNRSKDDVISTPLPGETLAVFYARSREFWAQKAHQSSDNRGKLLRRDGFAMAGERYAEYKPILEEVEKILAEAGLDEEEMKRVGGSGNVPLASGRNRR